MKHRPLNVIAAGVLAAMSMLFLQACVCCNPKPTPTMPPEPGEIANPSAKNPRTENSSPAPRAEKPKRGIRSRSLNQPADTAIDIPSRTLKLEEDESAPPPAPLAVPDPKVIE